MYVETSMLQRQKSDCERLSNAAMEDYKTTVQQLRWYSGLKEELAKYGIPVDDYPTSCKGCRWRKSTWV